MSVESSDSGAINLEQDAHNAALQDKHNKRGEWPTVCPGPGMESDCAVAALAPLSNSARRFRG